MMLTLVEVALRALLVAAAVWGGLRILGVRDVLAQKAAWGLVLAAALLVPVAMRWRVLPSSWALHLPAQSWLTAAAPASTPASPPALTQASSPVSSPVFPGAASGSATAQPSIGTHQAISTLPPAVYPAHSQLRRSNSPLPSASASVSASALQSPSTDASAIETGSAEARSIIQTPPPLDRSPAERGRSAWPSLGVTALLIYLGICAVLLLRLIYGLTTAVSLWVDAEPLALAEAEGMRLRISRAVASPVTIGSGVVLPASYDEWDAEKLHIVLAHERSHIRQRDFYLQLLAGLYTALFWFSPLGWWLKRKLSDLGEAISDRAALEKAASRSSYAQVLLEFAAAPRPTSMGVAMARPSSLACRIERLLNESHFRQAFSSSPRRAMAAVLLVPAAFIGATALVRVEAASAPQAATATPSAGQLGTDASQPQQAVKPLAGKRSNDDAATEPPALSATPSADSVEVVPLAPMDAVTPLPPQDAVAPVAPQGALAPPAPPRSTTPPAFAPIAPLAPNPMLRYYIGHKGDLVPYIATARSYRQMAQVYASLAGRGLTVGRGQTLTIAPPSQADAKSALAQADAQAALAQADSHSSTNIWTTNGKRFTLRSGTGNGFAYSFRNDDDDSYALVTGPVGNVRFSGDWMDGRRREIEKASQAAHGKFLWFEHEDKSYVVDDPAVIASIEEMYKPMDELSRKQEELGKQQDELGRQQDELGRKQDQASIPTPDVSKEMAELNQALAKLQAKKGGTMTQEDLSELQEKIGDLQGRIGDIQGKIGDIQGQLGEQQGALGEKQGKLGEEQGRLGEQQGRLAEEADRKVKTIIDESLKNGKARPVQ